MFYRIWRTISLVFIIAGFPLTASALQPDAPYQAFANKHQSKFSEQDNQIKQKLSDLQKKFGKRPNVIVILADDVGWGELGSYLGGKLRGTPTPNLDKMAKLGMKFLSSYAEPSCTPTRIALMTGRHPVRTGLNAVLWPGQTEGLAPEEETLAEILSKAGYHTAMWGKWHLGELVEHAPENQGFDQSYYSLYNGAAWAWPDVKKFYQQEVVSGSAFFYDYPGNDEYKKRFGITIEGVYKGVKGKGREVVGKIDSGSMVKFEDDSANQIIDYIKDKAKSDKPFFIYWATFAQQVAGSPPKFRHQKGVDSRNNQAAELAQHDANLQRILDTLKDQEIAENTLVIWYSDNGPMYAFWPTSGYTWLRGEKGEVTEGGVRVPAIAYWPGMIEPGQDPIDLIHVTDVYTSVARIAGATAYIPNDRVTDGIDQTSLLLLGEGNSRRDYIIHYSGTNIGAIRYGDYKALITGPGHGGLPGVDMYNIARDPGEKFGKLYPLLWMITPFQNVMKSHLATIKKFPHRVLKPEHDVPPEAELTPHD